MPVRLMIVDDNADVRILLRAIVEDADRTIDVVVAGEADGARAALESIDQVDPDVVVLDALMPVVGGLEAAPMILARRPGQTILMCSAFVDDDLRANALAAGAVACVSKDDLEAIPRLAAELARG